MSWRTVRGESSVEFKQSKLIAQLGRGQAALHKSKPTRARARPAGSRPSEIEIQTRLHSVGLETCGGALGVLLVLICVGTACPLPNCAFQLWSVRSASMGYVNLNTAIAS